MPISDAAQFTKVEQHNQKVQHLFSQENIRGVQKLSGSSQRKATEFKHEMKELRERMQVLKKKKMKKNEQGKKKVCF